MNFVANINDSDDKIIFGEFFGNNGEIIHNISSTKSIKKPSKTKI